MRASVQAPSAASPPSSRARYLTGMAEPPSGTVTLLFSDIEGSTRLLRARRRRRVRRPPGGAPAPARRGVRAEQRLPRRTARATRSSSRSPPRATRLPPRVRASARSPSTPGRRTTRSACGWACTPASRASVGRNYVGLDVHHAARVMAAGARRAGAAHGDDPRAARRRASRSATSASTGSRTCPDRSASTSSWSRASRPTSRR